MPQLGLDRIWSVFHEARTQAIAVPRMRRVVCHLHSKGNGLIVMELVPNSQQLRAACPSLSILGEFKVILTMRLYLRQLRRVQHTSSNNQPEPLGPKPLPCNGSQFGFDPKFPTIGALMNILLYTAPL